MPHCTPVLARRSGCELSQKLPQSSRKALSQLSAGETEVKRGPTEVRGEIRGNIKPLM